MITIGGPVTAEAAVIDTGAGVGAIAAITRPKSMNANPALARMLIEPTTMLVTAMKLMIPGRRGRIGYPEFIG